MPIRKPVFVGDRLMIHGRTERSTVASVEHCKERNADRIELDWDGHGRSYVWSDEEGDSWLRWNDVN